MAIVNVKERWSDAGFGWDISSRRARRVFDVLLDDPNTPKPDIISATGIPKYADQFPGDYYLRVRSADIARMLGPNLAEVVVEYESIGVGEDPSQSSDPLAARPEVEWAFIDIENPATVDIDGKPICTAAGELYTDVTRVQPDLVMRYVRNEAVYNATVAWFYQQKINADTFIGFPPYTCRCNSITARRHWSGTQYYWEVAYEFQFRAPDWRLKLLNMGTHKLVSLDEHGFPVAAPITYTAGDREGEPVTTAVMLDPTGTESSLDRTIATNYREFWLNAAVNFAPLNIR